MNITTVLSFALAAILFVGGLVLMGYAFETPGLEIALFSAGMIAIFISAGIPAIMSRNVTRKG